MNREANFERVKDRIKLAMSTAAQFERAELVTDKHDAAIQSAITVAGYKPIAGEVLVRCKKLVLAGAKPARLADCELMKKSAKLPRSLGGVLRSKSNVKDSMRVGTAPLGEYSEEKKLQLTRDGKSKYIGNQRLALRKKEEPIAVGPPSLNDKLRGLAFEVMKVMPESRCVEFKVYIQDGTYYFGVKLQPWDQVVVMGSVQQ